MHTIKFVDLSSQYLSIKREILNKIDEVLTSGDYILSNEVESFEKSFAKFCDTKYAVSVANGSDALFICLKSLGIGPGDEVITAPNSFVATAWAIANTGAKIVFCDVDETMNVNPNLIENLISKNTRAILPVHLTGRIANMTKINKISQKYDIHVLEDSAQAIGATLNGEKAGSFGNCAGFSLHPLKNLHVYGDGGIITTNDENIYHFLKKYRNHGLKNRNECEFWGVNSRLDEVQAGIANIKLKYINKWNNRHREIANKYIAELGQYVIVPRYSKIEAPVFHRFMIQTPQRNKLKNYLMKKGVHTAINYPIPLPYHQAAKKYGYKYGDFPVTEKLSNTILSLPIYPTLSNSMVDYVIQKVIQFFDETF